MRICMPDTFGYRGAGLGNELFPWAKAFLASQALGARLAHPAWGLNGRQYHRDFGTSRLDWLQQGVIKLALPTVRFDEPAYRATGKNDFQEAVTAFAAEHDLASRRHFVFRASGMWGGFHAIRKARVFVLAELLKAKSAVHNVHAVLGQVAAGKALVAVHIRRGDFQNLDRDAPFRGRFNVALPLEWYLATCASIRRNCGDEVQFLLLTDASADQVRPVIDALQPLTTFNLRQTACSDLLLMAFADSIVCSVSSYSMWGAFLSNAPYIWCAPNLQDHQGYGSLWGHETAQQAPLGTTALNLARLRNSSGNGDGDGTSGGAGAKLFGFEGGRDAGRGVPVDFSGAVPPSYFEKMLGSMRNRAIEKDLIFYGAVPMPLP
jgi:hypothetical protein